MGNVPIKRDSGLLECAYKIRVSVWGICLQKQSGLGERAIEKRVRVSVAYGCSLYWLPAVVGYFHNALFSENVFESRYTVPYFQYPYPRYMILCIRQVAREEENKETHKCKDLDSPHCAWLCAVLGYKCC